MVLQTRSMFFKLTVAIGFVAWAGTSHADLSNSVYIALDSPCRIVNTLPTKITSGTSLEFLAYGSGGDLSSQGGDGAGCSHPKATTGVLPIAIAANVTAVGGQATGNGNLVAFPFGGTTPSGSLVNYRVGVNIANSTIIGLCDPATGATCTKHFEVQSNFSDVPAIVDVQGYFYPVDRRIAQVALNGGDYNDPNVAIGNLADWCGTPSATNRCLIEIGPGEFNLGTNALELKSFVSVRGSSVMNTILKGGTSGGLVKAISVQDSELSELSIENLITTSVTDAIGIEIDTLSGGSSPYIHDVAVDASGASSSNVAISIADSASSGQVRPRLINLQATTQSGSGQIGVRLGSGSQDAQLVAVIVASAGGVGLSSNALTFTSPVLFSTFAGGTSDVTLGGGTQIVLSNSHLINGTINSGGSATCVSVTAPTKVLTTSCN